MKKRNTKIRVRDYLIVLLGIGFGLLFWIVESALHVLVFHRDNFVDEIFTTNPHEIWLRSLILCILTVFGVFAQISIKRKKQAEGMLKESEERRLILFESANDPIFIGDTDGSIIDVNKRAVSLYGYTREEFLRMKISDITVPEQLEEQEESRRKAIEKGEFRANWRKHIAKNGDILNVDFNASIINIDGKDSFISIIRDYTSQKQAEEALLERDTLLRRSQEFSRMVSWDWHFVDDSIKWSGDVTSIFGRSTYEMARVEDFFNTLHNEDLARVKKLIETSIDAGEEYQAEFRVIWPDGSVHSLLGQGNILLDTEGQASNLIGIVMDITERKQKEEEIKASESKFRELFNNMSSGVAVYQAKENGNDFVFKEFNRAAEQIEKIKKEDLIGKSILDIFPGVKAFGLFDVFQRVWKTEIPEHYPVSFYKDQRIAGWRENYVYRLPSGEIVAIYDDITESKQAEEALRKSEERYRTLFETTGTATFVIEEDTTLRMTNTEFIDRFGYSKEELVGKSWTELVHKDDLERLKGYHHLRRIDPDSAPKNYELRLIDAQCDVRYVLISITMIPGTKQSIGSLVDITDLKRTQESLRKLNEKLENRVEERTMELKETHEKLLAAERMAVLGKFSGSISHEIRNPLGVIDSSVYYLKAKLRDADKKVLEHLDRIKAQVKHSTDIIESLLNLTRMEEPKKDRINLAEVVNNAVSTSKIPDRIKLVREMPDEKLFVEGDREQLQMTFKNIIKNAIEAMENKGTLMIRLWTRESGNSAEVAFEDTGSGIADENLSKVFQPLFSTKTKGIGFGLSICQQIVEKHGGTIEAKSEQDRGASFIVRLPLTTEHTENINNGYFK